MSAPDWEFDDVDEDERAAFARDLGDIDERDLDEVEWEQYETLLSEYARDGQIDEDLIEALESAWYDFDDVGWEVDFYYEAPDGDTGGDT